MLYFDVPTQVEYKFIGQPEFYHEGIAFLDQIINLETGNLIDLAEVIIVNTYDNDWRPLSIY